MIDNKKIAKNTLMLYMRMFLVMAVSLFSFRILLLQLGEAGYGVYNVVGGVVVLFSFISQALTQSCQRYLSYYIGKNDSVMLQKTFSMSINVYLLISLVVLIIAETLGLWFLNKYMNFPEGMIPTANYVYQCSIFTFLIQIITIPYTASIISHEKMSFYAYFSIIEVSLKLSAVLFLYLCDNYKVEIYAFSILLISCAVWIFNRQYCRKFFNSCRYKLQWDNCLFKSLLSFSGWNMLGGIGNVAASQGVNIIFNIFNGVLVNVAMGISNQVSGAVSSFVSNMQTAFNPQIIKSYAAEEFGSLYALIFRSSRFSFLLIFIIGFPVMLCCETILRIWLSEVPEYSVPFTQLIIAFCMVDAMSGSLWVTVQASGKVKIYMIIVSSLIMTNLPAAYIILSFGLSPVYVMLFKVIMNLVIHFVRIWYLHVHINFPTLKYINDVMKPIVVYILLSAPLPLLLSIYLSSLTSNVLLFVGTFIICGLLGFYILLNSSEREFLLTKIKAYIVGNK